MATQTDGDGANDAAEREYADEDDNDDDEGNDTNTKKPPYIRKARWRGSPARQLHRKQGVLLICHKKKIYTSRSH